MYSMTGYGKGIESSGGKTITIEIKTVNHRYLDWGIKMPKGFLFLEDDIKKTVGAKLSRGHLDLYLTYEQTAVTAGEYSVDTALAQSYLEAASKLQYVTGLANDITLSSLLRVPDILDRKQADEDEALLASIAKGALNKALDALLAMREREGGALKNDINAKLDTIQDALDRIVKYAPSVVVDYKDKLNARIADAVAAVAVDQSRLATEIALYADRCSIDEEITRLSTHIVNMRALLESSEPVGRKLDFLVQELNRETNTIGSKANDLRITNEVLAIKNEIEKIREQAQNVE